MNHLSLFNGIGGFMLAAEMVGWNSVAYVEKIKWLNQLMQKHYPNAKAHEDIKDFEPDSYAGTIDIISGGDPCQPHSVAGLGRGTEDNRYLWPEMFRIIRAIHPAWVINENVNGTISNGVLDLKINDLESAGYACQAYNIPAESVGALHKRERIWLIANDPNCQIESGTSGEFQKTGGKKQLSKRHKVQHNWQPVDLWPFVAHPDKELWQKQHTAGKPDVSGFFGFGTHANGNIPERFIESAIIRMLNGLPEGLDYNNRNKRCEALGNAIVWQVAYEIFKCIDILSKNITT